LPFFRASRTNAPDIAFSPLSPRESAQRVPAVAARHFEIHADAISTAYARDGPSRQSADPVSAAGADFHCLHFLLIRPRQKGKGPARDARRCSAATGW
jgi:hypothetical protein